MTLLVQNPKEDCKQLIEQGLIHRDAIIHPGVYLGYNVEIGAHTEVKPGAVIAGGVKIGENCLISPNVSIIRGQQNWMRRQGELSKLFSEYDYTIKSPRITNNVFIGSNSVILMDILAENVTIGALTFVTYVIEVEGTYCGQPATLIKDYSVMKRIV